MPWEDALVWVAGLVYAGHTDWRLPTSADSLLNGYQCLASEMCHLHYVGLGGSQGQDIRQSYNASFALFQNIQGGYYWSATTHPVDTENALNFNFEGGFQSSDDKSFERYVWPVHPGDISPVPEPTPLALLLTGSVFMVVLFGRNATRRAVSPANY